MSDEPAAIDPEPADKRTNAWKEWNARQGQKPVAKIEANPNVFAAAFLAGCESSGLAGDRLSLLKRDWHVFREFVTWVGNGSDLAEYAAEQARKRAMEEKAEAVERADREAEEARKRKAREAFGAKLTV